MGLDGLIIRVIRTLDHRLLQSTVMAQVICNYSISISVPMQELCYTPIGRLFTVYGSLLMEAEFHQHGTFNSHYHLTMKECENYFTSETLQ